MNLEELSLTELREKAKEEGIKSTSKFKKEELISILKEKINDNRKNNWVQVGYNPKTDKVLVESPNGGYNIEIVKVA